ncbi:hypothetical protein GALMADRAFT_137952 [Galerina marginata CBS 339.88]|uniref:Uncharacterized protein n=1 Tax=Galerina marginata (strain CBS 339.88) TaxID=685588 RepID=A0A067TGH0_GALM3|nr:hypothetical protein GALMADRAFT_137952 [Galerina marginata CBS 339.88]
MASIDQQGLGHKFEAVEATAPDGAQYGELPILGRGINAKGDAWCRHSPAGDCYHYLNSNGSVFFQNPNKSNYYWDHRGYSRYTSSDGKEFIINKPDLEAELSRFCFSCEGAALASVARR